MPSYPHVTPATLAAWAAAIQSGPDFIPTDNEFANLLAQVDVQVRRFIYDYLATKFDPTTEKLLATVVADASLSGTVKGSTSNSGTQQGIVQGTVSTPDLRDQAVSTAKIADGAVLTAKIGASQVTTATIADANVTTAKIATGAVTSNELATNAVITSKITDANVTTGKIADGAVTTAKLANNAVTSGKLLQATNIADLLIADGSKAFQSVAMSGDGTISSAGVLTLTAVGSCIVREKASNTTAGGATIAGGAGFTNFSTRGTSVAWDKQFDSVSMCTISTTKIILTAGKYEIVASVPAYSAGLHIARIAQRNTSDDSDVQIEYGSSEVAQLGVQTRSIVTGKFTVVGSQYFKIEHWTELVKGTNGLGLPTSSGGSSEIYTVVQIKKVST